MSLERKRLPPKSPLATMIKYKLILLTLCNFFYTTCLMTIPLLRHYYRGTVLIKIRRFLCLLEELF